MSSKEYKGDKYTGFTSGLVIGPNNAVIEGSKIIRAGICKDGYAYLELDPPNDQLACKLIAEIEKKRAISIPL